MCAAGKGSAVGPVATVALGAGEAAAALKSQAVINSLNAVSFESEIADVAPEALALTVEMLKDHAFLAWVKKFTCFPAGTQVAVTQSITPGEPTHYRTVAIETLKAGDFVLAREEFGSHVQMQRIEETFQRSSDHLRVLEFIDDRGETQTIRTTDDHPFWIIERTAFVAAGELELGMTASGPNDELQTLTVSRRDPHPLGVPVCNFRVAEFHTYFVAATSDNSPLLVHNNDKCDGANAPKADKSPSRLKGERMTSADDVLQQLKEIEGAQVKVRQGKSSQIIDSIEKSKQRAKNRLKQITDLSDLEDLE